MENRRGQVIDLFSRKTVDKGVEVADMGRYVGNIGENEAEEYRANLENLMMRQQSLMLLVKEWEEDYAEHVRHVHDVLRYLGVKTDEYDPVTEDIQIDETGHVWIIQRKMPPNVN